jgi:hypothetical protein
VLIMVDDSPWFTDPGDYATRLPTH